MVDSACYSIETPRLVVRRLTQFDVSERYVSWLNDNEITKHLEIREQLHTKDSCIEFVSSCLEDENTFLLAYLLSMKMDQSVHVGNVNRANTRNFCIAEISYFIGDQSYHGKGFGVKMFLLAIWFRRNPFKSECAYASIQRPLNFLPGGVSNEVTLANEVVNARGEREDFYDCSYARRLPCLGSPALSIRIRVWCRKCNWSCQRNGVGESISALKSLGIDTLVLRQVMATAR